MKQVVTVTLIRILSHLIVAFRNVKHKDIPEMLTIYFKSINVSVDQTLIEKNIDKESIQDISQLSFPEKLEVIGEYFENLCGKSDLIIQDRIIIFLHIILYVVKDTLFDQEVTGILKNLALKLNLTQEQFDDLYKFTTLDKIEDIQSERFLVLSSEIKKDENQLEGSWIESNIPSQGGPIREIEAESFKGTLVFVYLEQLKSFIVKRIENSSRKNPKLINDHQLFNMLGPGDELHLNENYILEYHDIKKNYLQGITKRSLRISARNIEFLYNPPFRGLKEFSFREETGQLIGVIGQEGVGKTTLLKMIAGEMKPDKGTISINGFDLNENIYLLKGIIGNVTEEDMLFEELTVYENIYLTAKFFFSDLSEHDLLGKINDLMEEIGLVNIRDVRVGSFSEKNIQPGQRRLVNIALELLREPDILVVDDAIERLNMADSSKVIKVLHQYTFKGKLVVTSISQTSESVFRMFDKIWVIDEGGFPIFQGSPLDAYNYFSREVKHSVEEEKETSVKHVSPETILDLVNTRKLDSCGNESLSRKYLPEDWNHKYRQFQNKLQTKISKSALPRGFLKTPNLETQFRYYSIRNFRTKFYQKRMLFITLLVGPLTAFILGFILRNRTSSHYLFSGNMNLSIYYYTSILISFFFGLIGSAREIMKEKHILNKEEYLNFSRFSYVNSKITFLFIIAGIQTLLYALTGNLLLEIHGMTLYFWLLLFSMASLGSVLGLIFSCSFRSDVVIYGVAIPVAIALQFFLGGGYISYKNLNLNKYKYTPISGDLMPAR
jgi:ABC transport system ATP-binding/permease protein